MIVNVISKRKTKRGNTNVDINKDSRIGPIVRWVPREHDPVRVVRYVHYFFAFAIEWT